MNQKQLINSRLLDARFDARLSITEVSALLGSPTGRVIGRIERGQRRPSIKTAIKLEIIYSRPLAYLLPALYETCRAEVQQARAKLTLDARGARKGRL